MREVEHIATSLLGGIARFRVERPQRRNALTGGMYRGLAALIREAGEDPAVRCIIIEGSNGIFTSGSDINAFLDVTPEQREAHFALVADLFLAPSRAAKPVVAAVAGHALGGGTGLAAACDLVVAEENAVFGLPEIRLGLWPCTLLPAVIRAVGPRRAYEMSLLGETLSAEQAHQAGLVTRVVPRGGLEAAVQELAEKIAALPPVSVASGKRAFQDCLSLEFNTATAFMGRAMALNSAGAEAREGIAAFLEKRTPAWTVAGAGAYP
ncbi:enoyl-CoA hydratase/isomerase family protein [Roseomonas chloroacetimidivorans]|uniref:enoyl-CoA hydratase/isomerase family protein n=1 Tax=Roseomonas chloroacetimidivorans TaxID=1766656 RepID=UPI003C792BA0